MSSTVLKKWLQKPLVLALLLNAVALIISLLLSNGKFYSLDDHFMAMALTGAYGGGFDPHLYFVNSVYAYFLWPFYKLFPGVGWYTIFQIVSVFLSFTTICFVVLKKCGIKLGTLISAMLIVCVSTDFYLKVAFTQCAGALMASGILLTAFSDQAKEESKKCRCLFLAVAVLLAIGGYVMRKDVFLLAMPTLCVVLFINFVKVRSIFKPTFVAIAILMACIFGIKNFDKSLYTSDGYDYYAAYQPLRSTFGDGAYYDQESLSDEMDELGEPGSIDYRYLKSWFFYDKKVYSADSLREKIKLVQRNSFKPNYIKMPLAVIRAIADNSLTGHFWCWIVLGVALVFFRRDKSGLVIWFSLGILSLCYTYLLLVNRVVDHVEVGIWLLSIVILLNIVDDKIFDSQKLARYGMLGMIVVCVFGVLLVGANVVANMERKGPADTYSNRPDWDSFLEYAATHKDDVFLLPFDRYKELPSIKSRAFRTPKPDSWSNIVSLGYWNIHFPPIEKELAKRGVTNPMHDIVNKNVYVMDEVTKMGLAPFYKVHYHEKIAADTVKEFGDMKLLKYRLISEAENEEP